MKKVTEANFKPKSIFFQEKGVKAAMNTTVSIEEDRNSVTNGTLTNKDEPHPDFVKAMDLLKPVVAYDESVEDQKQITIKGVEWKKDSVRISHSRVIQSGEPTRKSAWIALDSEDFTKSKELRTACEKIKHEAYEYFINYKRLQLTLHVEDAA